MAAGSPVWFAGRAELDEAANSLTFDFDFISDPGAKGLLSIYWSAVLIGVIDDRHAANDGFTSTSFMSTEQADHGMHHLAFRLDSYSDVQSLLLIDQVSTGKVVPEPTSLALLLVGGFVFTRQRRVA